MEDEHTHEKTLRRVNQDYTKFGLASKPRINQSYGNVSIAQEPKKRNWMNVWRISALCSTVAFLVTLSILLTRIFPNFEDDSERCTCSGQGTIYQTSETCLDLKHRGFNRSGIKSLKLHVNGTELYEAYCEMETDGGGWTLVASIHESEITAKCANDDRWSAYTGGEQYTGKTNWENKITFGNVRDCMRDDYKNEGYYKIDASDVMVWHVRSQGKLDSMQSGTMLKYRSANQFLQKYGGNLKNLFSDHFPITAGNDYRATILHAVSQSFSVKNLISGWYNYSMPDYTTDQITDHDMFGNYGNMIRFVTKQWWHFLQYGKNKTWPCQSTSFSTLTSPSMALILVRNDDGYSSDYAIQVYSNRIKGEKSNTSNFTGTRKLGNFEIYYRGNQFYEPSQKLKTECRFSFYVSSTEVWNSKHPSALQESFLSINSFGSISGEYKIDGSPARILFGYILLSRDNGMIYTKSDVDAVAESILKSVHTFQHDLMKAQSDADSVTVPVIFDRGSIDVLNDKIPTEMRSQVQSGHLQFRAYNLDGYANALCPGIRVTGVQPEYACVGGVSNDISTYGTCGDYAGWYGVSGDVPSHNKSSAYGHSLEDIASTLLIFYR